MLGTFFIICCCQQTFAFLIHPVQWIAYQHKALPEYHGTVLPQQTPAVTPSRNAASENITSVTVSDTVSLNELMNRLLKQQNETITLLTESGNTIKNEMTTLREDAQRLQEMTSKTLFRRTEDTITNLSRAIHAQTESVRAVKNRNDELKDLIVKLNVIVLSHKKEMSDLRDEIQNEKMAALLLFCGIIVLFIISVSIIFKDSKVTPTTSAPSSRKISHIGFDRVRDDELGMSIKNAVKDAFDLFNVSAVEMSSTTKTYAGVVFVWVASRGLERRDLEEIREKWNCEKVFLLALRKRKFHELEGLYLGVLELNQKTNGEYCLSTDSVAECFPDILC